MSFRFAQEKLQLTRVSFRVIAPVRYGESVYLVGDVAGLGSGDPAYGIPLVTTPEKFPEWFSRDPVPLEAGREVKYRYAIFSGGEFNRWEDREDSRLLQVKEGVSMHQTVSDEVEVEEEATGSVQPGSPGLRMQMKKLSRTSTDSGDVRNPKSEYSQRKRKGGGQDLDDEDGVIIVSYYLPVRITKLASNSNESGESDTEPKELENKGIGVSNANKKSGGIGGERNKSHLRSHSTASTGTDRSGAAVWHVEWDESALLSRKKSSVADDMRVLYIGYPKCNFPLSASDHESLASALVRFRCVPVFLDPQERELHYHVYCYDTLRKLFHHQVDVYAALPTRWWNGPMHEASWIAYRSVNQAFAEKVVEVYNEGDIVWIHGFELLLLPSLLARRLQAGKPHIGLFVHSPFPSSEIFRTLSVRDDILRGMLNADQIGFHLYEYARPFLSCCHRILGIQHHGNENEIPGILTVEYQGRRVYITVCHAGIEPDLVRKHLRTPRVAKKAQLLLDAVKVQVPNENQAENQQSAIVGTTPMEPPKEDEKSLAVARNRNRQLVIVGLDEMEFLRGVSFKLTAFEAFLNAHPEWANRVSLLQVCLKVERDTAESIECKTLIRQIARRINKRYPQPPGMRPVVCLLEWSTCSFEDRLALFSLADLFLNTPLRAGLGLQTFEFTVVANERKKVRGPWSVLFDAFSHGLEESGTEHKQPVEESLLSFQDELDRKIWAIRNCPSLVLSEFTAAFRVLPASLRCNPWREKEVLDTLMEALEMSEEERHLRNSSSLKYVNEHVESGWALRVLTDIKSARPLAMEKKNEGLTPAGIGLGLQFRAVEFRPNFKHLDDALIIDAYRTSMQRLIILDYGGTTVSDDYVPHDANAAQTRGNNNGKFEFRYRPHGEALVPSERMITVLSTLVNDPCNAVFIVSGRERRELEAAFADIPGIGLTAEHGCFYSWGNSKKKINASSRTTTPPLIAASKEEETVRRHRSVSAGSQEEQMKLGNSALRNKEDSASRKVQVGLQREWVTLSDRFEDSWMDLSEQIMDVYTQRTNGTYIERKGSSVVWQYRDAEPEFGALQASELQDHLHGVLKAFPTEVVSGKGYVEVCPLGVDKGNACANILDMLFPEDMLPDFILCIGDDIADEGMFEFFLQLQNSYQESESASLSARSKSYNDFSSPTSTSSSSSFCLPASPPGVLKPDPSATPGSKLFTAVVGEKPSVAQYYVNDVDEVCEVLGVLARVSAKTRSSRSMADVRSLQATAGTNDLLRRPNDSYSDLRSYNNSLQTPGKIIPIVSTIHEHSEEVAMSPTAHPTAAEVEAAQKAMIAARASGNFKSFLDLRLSELKGGNALLSSTSMPALSEFFSLDVSQPVSTTANEYLDLIADDDDDGITF